MMKNLRIYILLATLSVIALLAGIAYFDGDKFPLEVTTLFGTKTSPKVPVTVIKESPPIDSSMLKGKLVIAGNFGLFGVRQIAGGDIPDTNYSVSLVASLNKPEQMMVLLVHNLEKVHLMIHGVASLRSQGLIIDAKDAPNFKVSEATIVLPHERVPCTWHSTPLVAVLDNASGSSKTVIAGWQFDLTNEHIVIAPTDRKSTRLNSSHLVISYAVFCLKKKQ